LPATTYILQGGAVALAEAYGLQRSISALLRASDAERSEIARRPPPLDGNRTFGTDFVRGFSASAGQLWSYGFVEILSTMRQGADEGRRALALWSGRTAMLCMALLALHADASAGILHDFLGSVETPELNVELRRDVEADAANRAAQEPIEETDLGGDLGASASLASDVLLQDIPMDIGSE
jgi:hypothetical protein